MGLWSNFSNRYDLNLDSTPASAMILSRKRQKGIALTQDESDMNINRVPKDILLYYYMKDPLTFNSVNHCTTITMQPGFELTGNTREYDYFFARMRLVGDNTSLRRLILGLVADRIAYGASFAEYILDESQKEIIDLRRVNATKIDYARDNKGNLIIDEYGKPMGFVMDFGFGYDTNNKGDSIPREAIKQGIKIRSGQVFIRPERIAIFPLYKLPNNFDYIGIIEPAADAIRWRRKIQEAQVNAINIKATSPYVMTVGDIQHEPTSQMMDDADRILMNIDESKAISLPYTMKLGTVESKSLDIVEETIKSLMFDQASASAIPLPLLTGAGEATNRSTLSTQREMYESNLQAHIDNFVEDWNMQVMLKLKEVNGYKGNCFLSWHDVRMESRDEKNKRLMEAIDHKVFAPQEVREYLKNREKVPLDEGAYKEFISSQKQEKIIKEKIENIEEKDDSLLQNSD